MDDNGAQVKELQAEAEMLKDLLKNYACEIDSQIEKLYRMTSGNYMHLRSSIIQILKFHKRHIKKETSNG